MSTHVFTRDPAVNYQTAYPDLVAALRETTFYGPDVTQASIVVSFTPDLTVSESATLTAFMADLSATYRTRDVSLTLAEYQAIKPDIAGLRTYAAIASPTLAQTVSAVKAQSRILRALLRD